jgi:aspartate/methionine/tyrosine aminotransferase
MTVRFSDRAGWPGTENAIARAWDARRASGLPCLDLTETNPTRVGLTSVEFEAGPNAPSYEPLPFGLLPARQAVASYHRERVPPERICLTASTSEAYSWLFKLLCEPGDQILVPAPSYPLFAFLARLEGVRIDSYPTRAWDDWSIDFAALRSSIDDRTKAIVVVSPNNPTGAVLHTSDLPPLLEICRERGLALISDEVFADYATPRTDRVASVAGEESVLTFVLSGLSKVCLQPQLKVGWIATSGPAAERDEALRRLDLIADTFLSVNGPAQQDVPRQLERRSAAQSRVRERVARNRTALVAALADSPATVLPADGGWSAVVRLAKTRSEEAWVLDFLQSGVLVHPGYFFDFAEEPFVIVSLIPEVPVFDAAMGILRERLVSGG